MQRPGTYPENDMGKTCSEWVLCRMAGFDGATSTKVANEGGISDTGSNNHGPPEVSIAKRMTIEAAAQEGTRCERRDYEIERDGQGAI